MQKMEWKPDQRGEKKGKINASFLLGRGWEKAFFSSCLVLQPGEEFAARSRFSLLTWLIFLMMWLLLAGWERVTILALKWWGMGRFQRPGGPGYPIHCAAHVPIAG